MCRNVCVMCCASYVSILCIAICVMSGRCVMHSASCTLPHALFLRHSASCTLPHALCLMHSPSCTLPQALCLVHSPSFTLLHALCLMHSPSSTLPHALSVKRGRCSMHSASFEEGVCDELCVMLGGRVTNSGSASCWLGVSRILDLRHAGWTCHEFWISVRLGRRVTNSTSC